MSCVCMSGRSLSHHTYLHRYHERYHTHTYRSSKGPPPARPSHHRNTLPFFLSFRIYHPENGFLHPAASIFNHSSVFRLNTRCPCLQGRQRRTWRRSVYYICSQYYFIILYLPVSINMLCFSIICYEFSRSVDPFLGVRDVPEAGAVISSGPTCLVTV